MLSVGAAYSFLCTNNMKINKILFLPFIILFFLFSCGKKEQTTEQRENIQKDVTQQDVPKTDEQKTGSKPNELGITEGLPSDYPSDIPKPKDADSLGTIKTSDETSIRYFTNDVPKTISDYYTQGLEKNGYEKADDNIKDDGGMVIWKKGKKEVSLMVARDKERNRTAVVISYK